MSEEGKGKGGRTLAGIAAVIAAIGGIYATHLAHLNNQSTKIETLYIEERAQFDPSPYDGNITSQTGISLVQCKQLCLDDANCKSLYWVPANDGSCWTKSLVVNGKYKNGEPGVGGIKRQR
ncbi:MAG: hypothetical protein F6K10_27425 [Moorea sp. SIO2B7]|nr:hypothetical protein [Moorena sp. SIO2B7]